jgi:hypothetical protein
VLREEPRPPSNRMGDVRFTPDRGKSNHSVGLVVRECFGSHRNNPTQCSYAFLHCLEFLPLAGPFPIFFVQRAQEPSQPKLTSFRGFQSAGPEKNPKITGTLYSFGSGDLKGLSLPPECQGPSMSGSGERTAVATAARLFPFIRVVNKWSLSFHEKQKIAFRMLNHNWLRRADSIRRFAVCAYAGRCCLDGDGPGAAEHV